MKATVLLVLALVAVALAATSPFDGQWTDKSGFDHDAYFCGDAQTNEFYGTYSEVGLLIGTLSNRGSKASGTWYQAGLGKCTTGSFEIVLSESGNSFSGSYSCSESPEIVIPWVETRISSAIPSDIQCGRLATRESEDARGKWLFGDFSWDVCVRDDAVYQSSYNFAVEGSTSSVTDDDDQMATINVGQGYESGQLFEKNKIMKGFYIENDGSQGVTLEFRVAGRQIVGFFWCTSSPYEHANAKDFDVCHSVEIYDKIGTEKDCERYTKLWPKGQQRPVNDPNNSFDLQIGSSDVGTFSSSVREVASMVVVCVVVLMALMF